MKPSTTIDPMATSASPVKNHGDQPHVFPTSGFVRLSAILGPKGPIPVGRTTWWEGVKSGRFPKPTKLGPRITVWRAEDIRRLFEPGTV